jgi:hypothetical protein
MDSTIIDGGSGVSYGAGHVGCEVVLGVEMPHRQLQGGGPVACCWPEWMEWTNHVGLLLPGRLQLI